MEKYNYSIIIPHYNIPNLLKRLISTLPQRDDVQVIVVDDCSNAYLEEYEILKKENTWIEWYSTGINGGGGKARNIGLKYAKGEFVIFADADDFFLPNLNDILNSYKNNNKYDLIFFNSISVDSDSLNIGIRGKNWNNLNNREIIPYLKFMFGEPWCKLIKLSLIRENKIEFDELPIHNDTCFSYMVGYHAKKPLLDSHAIYCVTERKGSVSKEITKDNLKIRTEVFLKKNKFLKDNGIKLYDSLLFSGLTKNIDKGFLKEIFILLRKYDVKKSDFIFRYLLFLLKQIINKISAK